jgi:hypothetical protein
MESPECDLHHTRHAAAGAAVAAEDGGRGRRVLGKPFVY